MELKHQVQDSTMIKEFKDDPEFKSLYANRGVKVRE